MTPTNHQSATHDYNNHSQSKDVYIDSLLQQLLEKDSLLAEKETLISEKDNLICQIREELDFFKKKPSSSPLQLDSIIEDSQLHEGIIPRCHPRQHGLNYELAASVPVGSIAKISDYLVAQRKLHAQHAMDEELEQTKWYSPPVQRVRWGEDQKLSHADWGDLFFDLFYVAAAYNLSDLLWSAAKSKEFLRGGIFFIGTLGPLWMCWQYQTYYRARYETDDYFHPLLRVLRHIFIALAISNVSESMFPGNIMAFILGMISDLIICMGLDLELYYKAIGDKDCIKAHTMDHIKYRSGFTFGLYVAALIIAAVSFARSPKEAGHRLLISSTETEDSSSGSDQAANGALMENEISRLDFQIPGDIPFTLTAIACILVCVLAVVRFYWNDKYSGDVRCWYVPCNIGYVIQRQGEFVMLMIGEGVLSLLTSPNVHGHPYVVEHYLTVMAGTLTMMFIQVLHFQSDHLDSSHHALYAGRFQYLSFFLLTQLLTISLIGFGVAYKDFLHGIYYEAIQQKEFSHEVTSTAFSVFLFLIFICLELMNVNNSGGIKKAVDRHFFMNEGERKVKWPIVVVSLLKVGILLFSVTLSRWTNEPFVLTAAGCAAVIAMSVLRMLNSY